MAKIVDRSKVALLFDVNYGERFYCTFVKANGDFRPMSGVIAEQTEDFETKYLLVLEDGKYKRVDTEGQ